MHVLAYGTQQAAKYRLTHGRWFREGVVVLVAQQHRMLTRAHQLRRQIVVHLSGANVIELDSEIGHEGRLCKVDNLTPLLMPWKAWDGSRCQEPGNWQTTSGGSCLLSKQVPIAP